MAAKRRLDVPAQVGAGDPNILAHPGFRQIPKCLFPLKTPEGQKRYDEVARLLFDAGRFTQEAHHWLSSGALQFDAITRAQAEDRPLRASWFSEMNKAFARLKLDDLDQPIAAPSSAQTNKFARNGFAVRRGWAVQAR